MSVLPRRNTLDSCLLAFLAFGGVSLGAQLVTLHRFSPLSGGVNADGANPAAAIVSLKGLLCGTTSQGGSQGMGTAFYLSADGSNFVAFRVFAGAPDVGNPQGDLALSGATFFGASLGGGSNGVGTVFSGQTNGSVSLLRSFAAVSADDATNSGGASPATLFLSGGQVYGTTAAGGAAANGTVFSLTTNGTTFLVLHSFSAPDSVTGTNTDGAIPSGRLVLCGATLFGTASVGGAFGNGVVFSVNTNGAGFRTLYSFTAMDTLNATNTDGALPLGGLALASNLLYGTTFAGGLGGRGTVFAIQTNGSGFTALHHFTTTAPVTGTNTDGASPCAALTLSGDTLYGTASAGGAGAAGTVFSLNTDGTQFQTLHSFAPLAANGTNTDGAFPVVPLLQSSNSLYGTTFAGGPGAGTVFSLALPLPPALITDVVHNPDGSVTLSFLGAPDSTNVIQTAADLTPPIAWQNLSTNIADGTGAWQFTQTNLTSSAQFYRSYAH
jgi:uncharacterized repeat protein (TIGR03803 family)